jgi:hypothetical protein
MRLSNGCPHLRAATSVNGANRVTLTLCRSLPVFPD